MKNPKFKLSPILKVIEEQMLPMQKDIEWGYLIPYMITGMLNEHPRASIEVRKTADKDNYAKFYEEIRDIVG